MSSNFHDALGRVNGLAVIDIVGTAVGAEVLYRYMPIGSSRAVVYVFAFTLGYVSHGVLGIPTKIN